MWPCGCKIRIKLENILKIRFHSLIIMISNELLGQENKKCIML